LARLNHADIARVITTEIPPQNPEKIAETSSGEVSPRNFRGFHTVCEFCTPQRSPQMATSSKIPRELCADFVAFVVHKIIATGCLSRNLRLPRNLDDDRVGQPDKQTWPNKKR
jgi:hypothetical protein